MPQRIYCFFKDREQPLRPESHLGRFMPHFSPADLPTGRGYAKTSIILKDERSVIFWDRSPVPIILRAFEGWTAQVMKGTRGSKNSGNSAGTYVTFCLHHSTWTVCFPGSGGCDCEKITQSSVTGRIFSTVRAQYYRCRAANKIP